MKVYVDEVREVRAAKNGKVCLLIFSGEDWFEIWTDEPIGEGELIEVRAAKNGRWFFVRRVVGGDVCQELKEL